MIMRMKVNRNGMAKYEILYRDESGRTHKRWSDWMRFDGYKIGDSIPVKIVTIPATCGLVSDLIEVNGHPQNHTETFILATAMIGVGTMLIGYKIGKKSTK
jgi:hypothetical protein